MEIVNRVHWIRARGQLHRWTEEFILTGYEMEWTVRHFLHQRTVWMEHGTEANRRKLPGAAAYACHKAAIWQDMAKRAEAQFMSLNDRYQSLTRDL